MEAMEERKLFTSLRRIDLSVSIAVKIVLLEVVD
jgi:hypothetical protein